MNKTANITIVSQNDSLFVLTAPLVVRLPPTVYMDIKGKEGSDLLDAFEGHYGVRPPEELETLEDARQMQRLMSAILSRPAEFIDPSKGDA